MWNNKKSVKLSLLVCFIVSIAVIVVSALAPMLFRMYFLDYRKISDTEEAKKIIKVVLWCLYPCAVLAEVALGSLIKLLLNIKKDKTFVTSNIRYLRVISWCCFIVAIITLVGAFQYPPFFFITTAAGFVGLILRVVKNVMQSAIELREENDLTI